MKSKLVWTKGFRPFIIGGDVNAPVGTTIDPGEKIPLGKGFYGYLISNPKSGKTHVVEHQSGAFVGNTIEQVRQHIEECEDIKLMSQQVKDALKLRKRVQILDPEQFWSMFKD